MNTTRQRLGSARPNAKLNEKVVKELRKLHRQGYSFRVLADMYEVSAVTVFRAFHGYKWAHVGGVQ